MTGEPSDARPVARIDLHCHTSASFDGRVDPVAFARRALEVGLTHIAITDHDTIDGALRARDGAPDGLTVLVGEEVLTREGDLVAVFLEEAIPTGLPAREAIAAARAQGALVGVPHPFDRGRRSLLRDPANEQLLGLVDWVEVHNGRVPHASVNASAAELARRLGLPGIAASDAHTQVELGLAWTGFDGEPGTPAGLLACLRDPLALHGPADSSPVRRSRLDRVLGRLPRTRS